MRRFLVAGNWKMNTDRAGGTALATAVAAADPGPKTDVLVCPPFPYLIPVGEALQGSGVRLGAQDVWYEPSGAFTGEVSVAMLRDTGCSHVVLGHSERRHILGETDETICRKVQAAIAGHLTVILCVGELLEEREAGQTEAVLNRQLAGGLEGISEQDATDLVIAYEPVWAIGTGVTASPDQAETAHAHIRNWLADRYNAAFSDRIRILYGGSVKPDNAQTLMQQSNVDGALVGGASLKADSFLAIVDAARSLAAAE